MMWKPRHLSQPWLDGSRCFRKRASVESTSTIIFTKKYDVVEIPVELLSTLALLAKLLKWHQSVMPVLAYTTPNFEAFGRENHRGALVEA